MWRTSRRARAFGLAQLALLPAGAYAVHQLRYLLAFGGNAGAILRETGHSYLSSVVPWLVALLALLVAGFLRRLGRSFAGHTSAPRYTASLAGLWLVCTLCLIAIFATQELLEGIFATGHAAGWIGVFGYGGWWAVPAAAIVGLVLASVFHGALWVLRVAEARGGRHLRDPARRPLPLARPAAVLLPPLSPLVDGWSGRGPPR